MCLSDVCFMVKRGKYDIAIACDKMLKVPVINAWEATIFIS